MQAFARQVASCLGCARHAGIDPAFFRQMIIKNRMAAQMAAQMAAHLAGAVRGYFDKKRMPCSSPSSVKGTMRPSISFCSMTVDCV